MCYNLEIGVTGTLTDPLEMLTVFGEAGNKWGYQAVGVEWNTLVCNE